GSLPVEAAVPAPQGIEPGRHAGHAERGNADRVVDQLGAEEHVELDQLGLAATDPEPRHRDEAVEVLDPAVRRLVMDAVAAAEQAGHDGLRDARGERSRDGGVGCAAAFLQDLEPRRDGRRMAGRDRRGRSAYSFHRPRASAARPASCSDETRSIKAIATLLRDRGPGRARSLARRAETAETRI